MIKKLKRKIITYIMLIVSLITIIFSVSLSVYLSSNESRRIYNSLENSINLRMDLKENPSNNFGYNLDSLIVMLNKDNSFIVKNNDLEMDVESINNLIRMINNNHHEEGRVNDYIYKIKQGKENKYIGITYYSYIKKSLIKISLISTFSSILFLLIIFLVSLLVSNIATKPVEKSIKNEKIFIENASHELKTPLSVISSNNEILLSNDNDNEWLNSNKYEIERMKELINKMLNLEKLESNEDFEIKEINLSKLVSKIALEFESVAYLKKISINLDIKDNVIIKFNEKMLQELLGILLDNALKYEKEEGIINIKVDNKLLSINNKNSYINKEELPNIFNRFYKIEKSRSKEGVGLGLAIAKEIVEKNKGSIKCVSEVEDGTTFIVSFN